MFLKEISYLHHYFLSRPNPYLQVWWSPQCGSDWVPNQLGSIPKNSLPLGSLCPSHLSRESLPWTADSLWNHQCLLWAGQPDGQVWPSSRQVHGLLHALPWWRRPQGRQCGHCHHQDQEVHPVCRLVPHWLQGRHQLPTPHCRSWRRPRQGSKSCLHALQHHCHRWGLGSSGSQVRLG